MIKVFEHFEFFKPDYSPIIQIISDKIGNEIDLIEDEIELENDQKLTFHFSKEEGIPKCEIATSYFIGLDRFKKTGIPIYVESKLNDADYRVDYIRILMEALKEPENFNHLDGLFIAKFDEPWIEIEHSEQPVLTPFLIAQFLNAVKSLVVKGLKKSYYEKTENLSNRIKGKILVGNQIKQNLLTNRLNKTVCSYSEYGFDTQVNQFLKYVLSVTAKHISKIGSSEAKSNLIEILNFCKGGFQTVSFKEFKDLKFRESNPFYKNYNIAITLGNQILKIKDQEINIRDNNRKMHPPFWIDMSKLFELFVFKKLREEFSSDVMYHKKISNQEPDFLINTPDFKAVVDAKYKPRYAFGNPSMEDARQLAGYTRLNSIYREFGIQDNEMIPAYFIYPAELRTNKIENGSSDSSFTEQEQVSNAFFKDSRRSTTYREMFLKEINITAKK